MINPFRRIVPAALFALGAAACTDAPTGPEPPSAVLQTNVSVVATGTIALGGPYNLRSGPGTNYSIVGTIPGGTRVTIVCTALGTSHTGPWGTTRIWDKLSTGAWITDAYVYTGTSGRVAPDCGAPPPTSNGFKIPLTGGLKWQVSAGIGSICGGSSHHGQFGLADCYAVDFVESGRRDVAVLAAAAGTIAEVEWTVPNPATPSCKSSRANRVVINHGNGIFTHYWHLKHNSVPSHLRKVGQAVKQGEFIGTMGNTGCIVTSPGRTGIHLHFRVNSGSTSGTQPNLKDFVVDGVRLRDFTTGREYQSSNTPPR